MKCFSLNILCDKYLGKEKNLMIKKLISGLLVCSMAFSLFIPNYVGASSNEHQENSAPIEKNEVAEDIQPESRIAFVIPLAWGAAEIGAAVSTGLTVAAGVGLKALENDSTSVSKSDASDVENYEKAVKDGTPVPGNNSQETEKNSLKTKGDSLSSKELVRNGEVTQRRYYDKEGKAEVDIDYDHSNGDGSHTFPHRHNWTWNNGSPSRGPFYTST